MSDEEQPKGGRYVTILRWAEGRAADRRERQAQFEALEVRVTRSFVEHVDHLEEVHQRQLATTAELAHAVRRVENVIEQQRGAWRLLVFIGVGTLLSLATGLVAAIEAFHR